MNIVFEDWWFLLLIPLLGTIVLWLWRRNFLKTSSFLVSSVDGLHTYLSPRIWLKRAVFLAKFLVPLFVIIALARPQRQHVYEKQTVDGLDIFLAMDVSQSMFYEDFKPNRLEASKAVAQSFVAERPNDRFGISVFAGEAYTPCPLTMDHGIVQMMLSEIENVNVQDGTAIGMGLSVAVNRLKESNSPSKIIILLTDGVNNSGFIQPEVAAKLAKKFNIKVYTIGIGGAGRIGRRGSLADQLRMQMNASHLDEGLLKNIAETTGGKYFRAADEQALKKVYDEINLMETSPAEVATITNFEDLFRYPLAIAGLLLILALIIEMWFVPKLEL